MRYHPTERHHPDRPAADRGSGTHRGRVRPVALHAAGDLQYPKPDRFGAVDVSGGDGCGVGQRLFPGRAGD